MHYPESGSAADERLTKGRDLVRRTSLLLSSDLPLPEFLEKLATLLAVSMDAWRVQITIGDERHARVEYALEDGVGTHSDRPGQPMSGPETERRGAGISVPVSFGGQAIGVLSVQARRAEAYGADDVAMLENCAVYLGVRAHYEEQRVETASLKQLAAVDALTGLSNRRSFDEALLREWRRCARSGTSLALAMVDVDYFKKFNDAYGHVAGDTCLRRVAQAIEKCAKRPGDVAARYGGEEFALILPELDLAGAVQLAELVCNAVREIAIAHQGSSLGYTTLSIGVAAVIPQVADDPQNLIAAADEMLYEAKKAGRNRVAADVYHSDAPVADARVTLRHNLPNYLTEFVGRENEVAEVATLLEASPLISIVGAGGVGKTRLAVQVAQRVLERYADGVWFVDLSPLEDPSLVPSAIGAVFEIVDAGGARPLIERVGIALKTKNLLLVVDNCEHVLPAATEAAAALLRICPAVRLLATSREVLDVPGSHVYRTPSLPVPPESESMTAQGVSEYGAAVLFAERACTAQPGFALTDDNADIVAGIVRRLDGIPLAIELAAARLKMLNLRQLDQRLEDRFKLLTGGKTGPSRHQTLRALIGWSYDLLDAAEQSLLRQLSIFRGAWTLKAAETVCIDERVADWDALDLLTSLVDKSLVAVENAGEEPRYRLLESTRYFAAERLTEAGEPDAVAARHCHYFAAVAERADDAFWHNNMDEWIAQVRLDLENHRAAIGWALSLDANGEACDVGAVATILGSLRYLWAVTARGEGRVILEQARSRFSGAQGTLPARVRGFLALAQMLLSENVPDAARSAAEAVRLWRGTDAIKTADALYRQALELGFSGHPAESIALFDDALEVARDARSPRLIGIVMTAALYRIGTTGAFTRAAVLYDEAAGVLRACNDWRRLALLQTTWAECLFAQGKVVEALAGAREAETAFRAHDADWSLVDALLNGAAYLLALGRWDEALANAREGLELAQRIDLQQLVARAIGHLAHVAAETGDVEQATLLLGCVDALYRIAGTASEPTERRGLDRVRELAHAILPEDRIDALLVEGAALDQGAAIALAMGVSRSEPRLPPLSF
jgi:diguanylate cyclase (GGDEF)-like protein